MLKRLSQSETFCGLSATSQFNVNFDVNIITYCDKSMIWQIVHKEFRLFIYF